MGNVNVRPRCPFYGFAAPVNFGTGPVFDDQKGNQCALFSGYTPCQMEIGGQSPDWSICRYISPETREAVARLANRARVFPRECPDGMSLGTWVNRAMGVEGPVE